MSVEVRLLVTSAQVLGRRSYSVPVTEPVTVGDVLRELPLPGDEKREIWADGDGASDLRTGLAVLINGRTVMHSGGLATPVHDGDRVSIIHGISGG